MSNNDSTTPADAGGSTGVSTETSATSVRDQKILYPMLAYALWYHRLGWPVIAVHHPIFLPDGTSLCSCYRGLGCPERDRGKHPVNCGWQKNEPLARKEFEIRGQWRAMPYANIGIPTGEKWGTFILDADGAEGIAAIRELERKLGPLPRTPLQRTGGGGLHWFFHSTGHAFPNSVSKLAPKVDTRGESGLGVVSTSLHRSGNRYAWLLLPSKVPLANLTESWVEYISDMHRTVRKSDIVRSSRKMQGVHRAASTSLVQAKRLLVQMLEHPLVAWATKHPDDVSREVWRGIGTNFALLVLEHTELQGFARAAFHAMSKGYSLYSESETNTVFDGSMKSAETHGPMTFGHMKDNRAPEEVCEGGTSLIHAARCRLSSF